MTENKEDLLRSARQESYDKIKITHRKFSIARKMYYEQGEKYFNEKREFEELDRELAMVDGRYKRYAAQGPRQDERKDNKKLIAKFSADQLLRIAAALDIELEVEEK